MIDNIPVLRHICGVKHLQKILTISLEKLQKNPLQRGMFQILLILNNRNISLNIIIGLLLSFFCSELSIAHFRCR